MLSLSNTPKSVWWLLAALWAALIFWLSSSPDAQGSVDFLDLVPYGDKLAHAVAFGTLGAFIYLASGRFWLTLFFASLYGISDEVHQYFVPGRNADMLDWLADTLGALAFILLVRNVTRDASN